MIDSAAPLFLKPHLHRVLGSERLVLAIDSEELPIRLNASAGAILGAFNGGASIDEVVALADVGESADQWRSDVISIVDMLISRQLLGSAPAEQPIWPEPAQPAPGPAALKPLQAGGDVATLWVLLSTFRLIDAGPAHGADLTVLEPDRGNDIVDTVERGGGLGLLAHAIDSGWVALQPELASVVQERWAANQMHCLLVEQLLVRSVRSLSANGFDHRVLKGVAVAHLDHVDPSLREFGDADLLLHDDEYEPALRCLLADEDLGLHRHHGEFGLAFQEVKGCPLASSNRLVLDVHRRINIGAFGARAPVELFEQPDRFVLAGATLLAPSRAARMIHAATHVALNRSTRPGTIADFGPLADVDPQCVAALARPMRLQAAVKRGLAHPDVARLNIADLAEVGQALDPTLLERALVSQRDEWVYGADVLRCDIAGFALTPGLRKRWSYLRHLAFPSKAYRRGRQINWWRSVRNRLRANRNPPTNDITHRNQAE